MNLSTVGIAHTVIGLVGVIAGLFMLIKNGRIKSQGNVGIVYFTTIAVSCGLVFALPRKTAGLNPGHIFTALTLLSLFIGFFARFSNLRSKLYIEVLGLSASLFFSLIPTINETLTRLPVGAPFATGPQDPLVVKSLGMLAGLFLILVIIQIIGLRKLAAVKNV